MLRKDPPKLSRSSSSFHKENTNTTLDNDDDDESMFVYESKAKSFIDEVIELRRRYFSFPTITTPTTTPTSSSSNASSASEKVTAASTTDCNEENNKNANSIVLAEEDPSLKQIDLVKQFFINQSKFHSNGISSFVTLAYRYNNQNELMRSQKQEEKEESQSVSSAKTDPMSKHNNKNSNSNNGLIVRNNPYADFIQTNNNNSGMVGSLVAVLRGKTKRNFGLIEKTDQQHHQHHHQQQQQHHKTIPINSFVSNEIVSNLFISATLSQNEIEEACDFYDQTLLLDPITQCLPILRFHTALLSTTHYANPGNELMWLYHQHLQSILDRFFNQDIVTVLHKPNLAKMLPLLLSSSSSSSSSFSEIASHFNHNNNYYHSNNKRPPSFFTKEKEEEEENEGTDFSVFGDEKKKKQRKMDSPKTLPSQPLPDHHLLSSSPPPSSSQRKASTSAICENQPSTTSFIPFSTSPRPIMTSTTSSSSSSSSSLLTPTQSTNSSFASSSSSSLLSPLSSPNEDIHQQLIDPILNMEPLGLTMQSSRRRIQLHQKLKKNCPWAEEALQYNAPQVLDSSQESMFIEEEEDIDLQTMTKCNKKNFCTDKDNNNNNNNNNNDDISECPICFEPLFYCSDKKKKQKKTVTTKACHHSFHLDCIQMALIKDTKCPICRRILKEPPYGTCPSGRMTITTIPTPCSGYENHHYGNNNNNSSNANNDGDEEEEEDDDDDCEQKTIVITYSLRSGYQTHYHPNPGTRYSGTIRKAYLPNTTEGQSLLKRLQYAFMRGMIFSIGTSLTSRRSNCIVWSLSIPHKTNLCGGVSCFGYPDPGYILDCNEQLNILGVPLAEDLPL